MLGAAVVIRTRNEVEGQEKQEGRSKRRRRSDGTRQNSPERCLVRHAFLGRLCRERRDREREGWVKGGISEGRDG